MNEFEREDEGRAKAAYWRKHRGIEHYIGTQLLSLSKKGIYFHILTRIFFLTFIPFKIIKYMLGIYFLAHTLSNTLCNQLLIFL